MPTYLHPGVYIEEIASGAKPIEGVSTSVAAFVGKAVRGQSGKANLIGKFADYVQDYGKIASENDAMGLAVQAFYLNGGGAAYICRLVGAGSHSASINITGQGPAAGGPTTDPVLMISATSEGDWGNDVYVQLVKPDQDSLSFTLRVGHREDGKFVTDEIFPDLTMAADDDNYALTQVNGNSSIIAISLGVAADPDNLGEQYRSARLTGGAIPATATYLSAGITTPMILTLNINNLGAEQITIDPGNIVLAGVDVDVDAAAVRAEIQLRIRALGTANAYQNFTCGYDGATNRFFLETPEENSIASIEVYTDALAELLGLDNGQKAELTGAGVGATDFSVDIPALADSSLELDIDNHGPLSITLDVAAMGLAGSNTVDGAKVALAIRNAVWAIVPTIPSYKDFMCTYSASQQFVLTSGSSSVRQSGLSVSDGPLADVLGLNAADNPTEVVGRQAEQGTANVIPIETLGTLDEGVPLAGGNAISPTANDFNNFYGTVLRKVRDVSIMLLPGHAWPSSGPHAIIDQTLAHASSMGNRMLIIDPPQGFELDQAATVSQLGLPTSTYSVLYYPWVEVANPFFNVDTNPNASTTLTIAPSAFAAGMWAKIDGKRGVWKAPAGVEAQLNGAAGLEYKVEDLEQNQLNPLGINCYRTLPNFGAVIWGSRTLATKADPEWRYVSIRRTAIFIEQSIFNGIQWAVFEPNDHPLWSALRSNIGSFMNGLFRASAFQGATANDAYFVRCGLGDTMTQGDIDRGQVIVIVGFAPLKPAEFVIVRIQQKVGQQ